MQAGLDKNYFELFGIPERFDLDIADITARYRGLQSQLHPDRYARASDQERRLSVQVTALVNEAFQTLKDPLKRGRYLLKLRGIDTDEESDTAMDTAFLAEQMELRESLQAVRDHPRPRQRLRELSNEVGKSIQTRTAELGRKLADGKDAGLEEARETVREMQFLEKMLREIEQLEEEYALE